MYSFFKFFNRKFQVRFLFESLPGIFLNIACYMVSDYTGIIRLTEKRHL